MTTIICSCYYSNDHRWHDQRNRLIQLFNSIVICNSQRRTSKIELWSFSVQVLTSVSVHTLPIDRTHIRNKGPKELVPIPCSYGDIAMFVFFSLSHCLDLPQRHRKHSSSNFDLKLYLQTHTDQSSLSQTFEPCHAKWFNPLRPDVPKRAHFFIIWLGQPFRIVVDGLLISR